MVYLVIEQRVLIVKTSFETGIPVKSTIWYNVRKYTCVKLTFVHLIYTLVITNYILTTYCLFNENF